MSDECEAAVGGTVPREPEPCRQCGKPMLFRVDKDGRVTHTFCGTLHCLLWLHEIEVHDP